MERERTRDRIEEVADAGSFVPLFEDVTTENPLKINGYPEKIEALRETEKVSEAISIGRCRIAGMEAVIGVCHSRFLGGSMGCAMGERITRAFSYATQHRLPVILFCASGGARMQEGLLSLMQMEKTAAAVRHHSEKDLFYISVLTDPTFGGVTASFATLADIIIAEKGARIGFAGRRVIEQTTGETLPKDAQSADAFFTYGMADIVETGEEIQSLIRRLLIYHKPNRRFSAKTCRINPKGTFSPLPVWERVQKSRNASGMRTEEYVAAIFDDFLELHGDRAFADDRAIFGGLAHFRGKTVTVLGTRKGGDLTERVKNRFGMPMPEGYRKVTRLAKQAEKFCRPIITFIDTPGAFCGFEAEQRGQATAIAETLSLFSGIAVPVLSIIVGEAGSGGALSLAVGNEVWMFENATYSVITPEGYAVIVYRDSKMAKQAAGEMGITAEELLRLRVIDRIIPEYGAVDFLKDAISGFLRRMEPKSKKQIVKERRERFRRF